MLACRACTASRWLAPPAKVRNTLHCDGWRQCAWHPGRLFHFLDLTLKQIVDVPFVAQDSRSPASLPRLGTNNWGKVPRHRQKLPTVCCAAPPPDSESQNPSTKVCSGLFSPNAGCSVTVCMADLLCCLLPIVLSPTIPILIALPTRCAGFS